MTRHTPEATKRSLWPRFLVLMLVLIALSFSPGEGQPKNPDQAPPGRPNRLAKETSPYLRQHANNPVDWYPWGPEALERSRRENKPIFLSIGYSACHWCHVMAEKCFQDPVIAKIMNNNFINIKVDREERPDLDEIYMKAAMIISGDGGWPLSVFLTPDMKPFFAGTFFPPKVFTRLLLDLSQAYRQDPKEVAETAQQVQKELQTQGKIRGAGQEPRKEVLTKAYRRLSQDFDPKHGGFGGAPKFPGAMDLGFLFTYHHYNGEDKALGMAGFSLEKMARGGIYDQLGGGFHRYSTDAQWLVPHFEKMLYDNALLVPLYLAQYQLTGSELGRKVGRESLDFVVRELGSPDGGFFASLDAESEGKEGKYYVWSLAEVQETVGAKAAPIVAAALGLTKAGNFEGKNIPTRPLSEDELAARFSLTVEQVRQILNPALEQLRHERTRRVPPARDDKIIVAWNGLMISALAQGTQVLGDQQYYQAAAKAARFLLQNLIKDGRLYHSWAGGRVSAPGFLDDYAFLANGLMDLFETDFDPFWLTQARSLTDKMEELFLDPPEGIYFYVGQDQKTPLVRPQSIYDAAIPSGNSLAALACLRLFRFTEESRFQKRAQAILTRFQGEAQKIPLAFPELLIAQILYLTPALDLTVVGEPGQTATQELLKEIYRRFLPERRLVLKNPKEAAALGKVVSGVQDYTAPEGRPVVYICRNFACLPPISDPKELAAQLKQPVIGKVR